MICAISVGVKSESRPAACSVAVLLKLGALALAGATSVLSQASCMMLDVCPGARVKVNWSTKLSLEAGGAGTPGIENSVGSADAPVPKRPISNTGSPVVGLASELTNQRSALSTVVSPLLVLRMNVLLSDPTLEPIRSVTAIGDPVGLVTVQMPRSTGCPLDA